MKQSLRDDSVRIQRCLIAPWNFGVFVFVGNHPAAFFDAAKYIVVGFLMRDLETQWMNAAAVTHPQVPRGFLAGIAVVIKPSARRQIIHASPHLITITLSSWPSL